MLLEVGIPSDSARVNKLSTKLRLQPIRESGESESLVPAGACPPYFLDDTHTRLTSDMTALKGLVQGGFFQPSTVYSSDLIGKRRHVSD